MHNVEKMGQIWLTRRVGESGHLRQPGAAARTNDARVNRDDQISAIQFATKGVLIGPWHGTIRS